MRTRTTFVYIHLAEGPVPAGLLDMTEDGRNSYATFRYGDRYLRRPDRVPVDPVALAFPDQGVADWEFRTPQDFLLFDGIRDAAPDGWGRYVMHKAAGTRALEEFDYLVATGEHRIGALAFGPDAVDGPKRITPWTEAGHDGDVGDYLDLAELAEAAERVQDVDRLDGRLRRFLTARSSLGGARPKAATEIDGEPWIAKFQAKDDLYPECRTELATMQLAHSCGLNVPETDFRNVLGRDIYLIKRFDRIKTDDGIARRHYASALTMLEALDVAAHTYAYRDLADVIRKHGSHPREDLYELYRRMAFNILVGNDDDHLRNHAFLYDGRGWRLSPLYDVVPRPRTGMEASQVLTVGTEGKLATLKNALSAAPLFGIRPEEALTMLEELRGQVASRWQDAFHDAGINESDIERFTNTFVQTTREI